MEAEIVTRSLQGTSDLTLVAPIRQGLVSVLDTRTYASRLRAILQTLNTLRQASREFSMVRTFSDNTDRIRTITDLRMVILEPEQKLLLSVTFDRPWEPYLRIIWREVGTLLDVIFCNCDGYPISYDSTFAEYGEWIRNARTNTKFFFKPTAMTYDDGQYLREVEKLFSDQPASDLAAFQAVADNPTETAKKTSLAFYKYTVKQGMQALATLYRLADLYEPDSDDGPVLLRASNDLLRELPDAMAALRRANEDQYQAVRKRFKAQLEWLETPPKPSKLAAPADLRDESRGAQGGILRGYDRVNCGCVLLLRIDDPKPASKFLEHLGGTIYKQGEAVDSIVPKDGIYVNAAFTAHGLRACGLSREVLGDFPHDFLEGMQERAGLLGDLRTNHPRNWTLPARNWPSAPTSPESVVHLSSVHLVVNMCMEDAAATAELSPHLHRKILSLMAGQAGIRLLSVQATRRYIDSQTRRAREHFGFIDGISQPEIGTPSTKAWSNKVGLGEMLLGYPNDRGDPARRNDWTDNGSFLVIRKLRQFVDAFDKVAADAAAISGHTAEDIKAKMIGRKQNGDPLVEAAGGGQNDFAYDKDAKGMKCPFSAHVRRANPRVPEIDGRGPMPRIMRRGMSYGPQYQDKPDAERGVMFMAYGASIAEQFEVIQRWMSGGNSTGVLSDNRDPIVGVPQIGERRTFRYAQDSTPPKVHYVKLDDETAYPVRPLVKLEWGLYLFAPSVKALGKIAKSAGKYTPPAYARPVNMPAKGIAEGEAIVQALLKKDAAAASEGEKAVASDLWKSAFEDSYARSYGDSEAVWAAIRQRGGVLRTSYGVVAATKKHVMEVLLNEKARYSVCGYVERLDASIGQMYLGMDDDGSPQCPYQKESRATNTAIYAISENVAFDLARGIANQWLQGLIAATKNATAGTGPRWDTTLEVKEISDFTLAKLCDHWFAMDTPGAFQAGGSPWNWTPGTPPYYPGHFTAPSRYVFQPNPGEGVESLGQQRGQALLGAMKKLVALWRKTPPRASATITLAVLEAFAGSPAADETAARTILGTLIGFLPTVEGNFRATMNEWLDERTYWTLQEAYLSSPLPSGHAKASAILRDPLRRTMQFRPAPEVSWRTALVDHRLGGVKVKKGDRVAFSLVSATQEDLANGVTDVAAVFGGDRSVSPHPTHACPGQQIGMGVLLGMLTALIEIGTVAVVRGTPAPLTVSLEGAFP